MAVTKLAELTKTQEILFAPDGSDFMEQVELLENLMINSGSPDIFVGNSDALPLTHSFSDGIYTREIFIKKGMFVIGKIHKLDHTFFLMKGKLRFYSQDGVSEVEAPEAVADSGLPVLQYVPEEGETLMVKPPLALVSA